MVMVIVCKLPNVVVERIQPKKIPGSALTSLDFSKLPFDPFTPFPELTTSPSTPKTPTTTGSTPTPPSSQPTRKSSQIPPPSPHQRRGWKPYGRTYAPNKSLASSGAVKNTPTFPPALINHTFSILGQTQERVYTSPTSLPTRRSQLPGKSEEIRSSRRGAAHYLTSGEPKTTTPRPRAKSRASSEQDGIVLDSAGEDDNSVSFKNGKTSDSGGEQTSKFSKNKYLSNGKSERKDSKMKDIRKLGFPRKEKILERDYLGKQGDMSRNLEQTGQNGEIGHIERNRKGHRSNQMVANIDRLRDEVEATMLRVLKTIIVKTLKMETGRRDRLRTFKVRTSVSKSLAEPVWL